MAIDSDTRGASLPSGHSTNGINGSSNGTVAVRTKHPIAIVGMSCKFAGDASSPSKLWDLCAAGQSAWSLIPEERFNVASFYHPEKNRPGRNHAVGGHFINEDIGIFDAGFFNLSADVANAMDPQLRLLLESVYEAIENAGIPLEKIAGSNTSVFSGCYGKDYHELQARDPEVLPASFLTGNGTAMLSNRISHFYDLQGASMSIDTGCSAGLVALHQGCQSILSGDSDLSIVGAASTILSPDLFIAMSSLSMIGADGKCYAWDARAHGYGRGEGVATLVLKRLEAAVKDGDHVHAVIREIGLNQDGKTATITSPSVEAQIKLIKQCYQRAGLNLSDTGYVEAHMTGTQVGDVAEAEALARTFGKSRDPHDPMLVSSVKTNVGHTEPVSGLAAVIKTALAMKNRQIPPNVNYEIPNPNIPLQEWNLKVPVNLTRWPHQKALRASINNFGYGGANAHVIIEGAPEPEADTNKGVLYDSDRKLVYVVSAKDAVAFQGTAANLVVYLSNSIAAGKAPAAEDLAYTLTERRSRLPYVAAIQAGSIQDLAKRLGAPSLKGSHATKIPRIGFVFNGQGAQWHAMGRELLGAYPIFDSAIRNADKILQGYGASWSLYDELHRDATSTRVSEVNLSQPITVALQLSLVDLLASWGVTPAALTSHSSGEIAAAYAVGALSFAEALGAAYYRGELALRNQELASLSGGMMAAGLGSQEAEKYISNTSTGRVSIACVNSGSSVTLSGDLLALDEVAARLQADGIFARRLKVPLAYHSYHMLHLAQDYTDILKTILPSEGPKGWSRALFVSPVTGDVVTSPEALTPEHWVRNLTSPVLFHQALERMCYGPEGANVDAILELGAHGTLATPIRQILGDRRLPYTSCLTRNVDAVETMLNVACELTNQGYPVSLKDVNSPEGRRYRFVHDLPSYAWKHTTRYWAESRVSKETRDKRYKPHELLGSPAPASNDLAPTWRNFLSVTDIPWLMDHQVDSKVVLPGAGYTAMAIEAARLLTGASSESIQGFRLQDVDILSALGIPDSTPGVETQITLRPVDEADFDDSARWYQFEISSLSAGGVWVKNCKGLVAVELEDLATTSTRSQPRADSYISPGAKVKDVDIETFFAGLRDMSLYHGPFFRNLTSSRVAENKAITELTISSVASEAYDYVLHPTTLDSIVQATYHALPEDLRQSSMVMPKSFKHMYVPYTLRRRGGDKLQAFTEMLGSDKRGFTSQVNVVNLGEDSDVPCFQLDGFHAIAVPRSTDLGLTKPPRICSSSRWEMDISGGISEAYKDSIRITLDDQQSDFERKMVRSSYHFIHDAIRELKDDNKDNWQWYHKVMYDWMKKIVVLGETGTLAPRSKTWARTSKGLKMALADELSAGDASGKLTVRVGQKLVNILRGEIAPLELMTEGNLLNDYYMNLPKLKDRTYKHLSAIAELYAVKTPGAKVLEIGAGTGGATKVVLEAFGARGDGSGSLLDQYTFTDVSSGFFEAGRRKLAPWADILEFKRLDIETDPLEQGFASSSYDVIVASLVLHATKSLHKTMSHVRKLLKPGGKLLLIETTQDRLDMQLIFGTLAGWWLSEEEDRKMSPNAPLQTWDKVLRDVGFTGIEFDIGDCEETDLQCTSLIVTSAATTPSYPAAISIVHTDLPHEPWLTDLGKAIHSISGVAPEIESLAGLQNAEDKVCVLTADLGAPFVHGLDSDTFEKLRRLLVGSRGLLWLSSGGAVDAKQPLFAETQGLLRTLRQEDIGKRIVQLDFDHEGEDPWTGDKINPIVDVFRKSFDYSLEFADMDYEYAVKNSVLHVPRVYPSPALDETIHNTSVTANALPQSFHQTNRPLKLVENERRIFFTDDFDALSPTPSGVVEIAAKAFSLSARGVSPAAGSRERLIAYDFAGIISRLGPDTEKSGLKVGDRVCGIASGSFASSVRTPWTSVAKLADDISFAEAASIPTAYITAYHSLFGIARIEQGDSILIHEATTDVGQGALILAQHVEATIFATYNTVTERQILTDTYNLDPNNLFPSTDICFANDILSRTGGRGVDIVLNSSVKKALISATWDCVAKFGIVVDIADSQRSVMPLHGCATYARLDVLQLSEYDGRATHKALESSIRILEERHAKPVQNIKPHTISDIVQVLVQGKEKVTAEKLIFVPQPQDKVEVISQSRPLSLAREDATYLIAGGLGGVGRAIASWMVEKGATNILLVSRHAETHPETKGLLQTARESGCNLRVRNCDVSNESELVKLIAECSGTMPPIRGVVNAAMVLEDTILERMSFQQWQQGTRTKVGSSVNLDKHLPDVEFFVMLSSLTGVAGHMSQANYAAGNTLQDALARHRTAHGRPARTLDLGAVESDSFLEADRRARIEGLGSVAVPIGTVLRLVEAAVRDPLCDDAADSQVIVGMTTREAIPDTSATKRDRRFSTLRLASARAAGDAVGAGDADGEANPVAVLAGAVSGAVASLSRAEGELLVEAALAFKLAGIFNIDPADIDAGRSPSHYGVDSLVAVDVRNWLATAARARLSIFEIMQSASLRDLAALVVGKSELLANVIRDGANAPA